MIQDYNPSSRRLSFRPRFFRATALPSLSSFGPVSPVVARSFSVYHVSRSICCQAKSFNAASSLCHSSLIVESEDRHRYVHQDVSCGTRTHLKIRRGMNPVTSLAVGRIAEISIESAMMVAVQTILAATDVIALSM
ncbi:hypothetical protein TNCV_3371231 [Trichonephila clavipes]|nr:hypothetical protein TNCV_3371231 [Trichonephila clavipes]